MSVAPAVITNVVVPVASETVNGSVRCMAIPVSPVTPFNVMVTTLDAGGTHVHATGVDPPVGGVMVFAPETNVLISSVPGLTALEAAEIVSVPTTSPEYTIVVTRVAVVANCHLNSVKLKLARVAAVPPIPVTSNERIPIAVCAPARFNVNG